MKIMMCMCVVLMFMVLVIMMLFLSVWMVWFLCEFSRLFRVVIFSSMVI